MSFPIKDLAGRRFGRYQVLSRHKIKGHPAVWLCRCDCGKENLVRGRSLLNGKTKSCGCFSREIHLRPIVGKRFGRLVVIKELGGAEKYKCIARCDCGNDVTIARSNLGCTVSCGCYQSERAAERARRRLTKPPGVASMNRVFDCYRRHAKERRLAFDLSFEQWKEIVVQPCVYCGSEKQTVQKSDYGTGTFKYTGIDRKNNLIGYTIENSVSCCTHCNRAKLQMSMDQFREWIHRVYWHFAWMK